MLTLCICIDKEKDIDMIRRLAGVFRRNILSILAYILLQRSVYAYGRYQKTGRV